MAPQNATPYAWLDASPTRTISDIALGCVLLAAAAAAIFAAGDMGSWNRMGPGAFPRGVGGLLAVVGLILLGRGAFLRVTPPLRWSLASLVVVTVAVAIVFVAWTWAPTVRDVALLFGPADYFALTVFILAVAVALARSSRIRAVGMVLLGLLLATVGTDLASGTPRFTFGLFQLADGFMYPVVVLGLIVLADAMLCLASPSLLLATYARRVDGWTAPSVPLSAGLAMRAVAVLVIAGAAYYAFELNRTTFDVGVLVAFGLFGLAAKLLGWNRLVLLPAFAYGILLEENIRRALLISRGDPATFATRPISGTLLALAAAILVLVAVMSVTRRGPPPA